MKFRPVPLSIQTSNPIIDVQFQEVAPDPNLSASLREAGKSVFQHQGLLAPVEISILVTSDNLLQEMNAHHLGEDHPTDVLSFPNSGKNPESENDYLGDLAISLERAQMQAEQAGHSLQDEMQVLVVHGILHLLAFDHDEQAGKKKMWAAQSEIFQIMGLDIDADSLGNDNS